MSDPVVHVMDKKDKTRIKIIVIGNPAVGKTSLIQQYTKHKIATEYMATIGSSITMQPVKILDGDKIIDIKLAVFDIAGQEKFHLLHKVYYEGAKGIVFVFDLTNPGTLTDLRKWNEDTIKYGLAAMPKVLVGNKADLDANRKVTPQQIQTIMTELNLVEYFETSAMTGKNVTEMFYKLAYLMYTKKIF